MANVTIADIMNNVEAAKPKFISPEIFQPATSAVYAFLRNFERCATANGWKATHKITYFGTFLEGAANTWYTKYIENPNNAQKTWEDIKAAFSDTFGGEESRVDLRRKLKYFRQTEGQGVKDYYYELLELLHDLGKTSDEEVQMHFEDGLSEHLLNAYYLLAEKGMSAETLRKIVFKLAKQVDLTEKKDYTLLTLNETGYGNSDLKYSGTTHGRPDCFNCGKMGHMSYSCQTTPILRRCYECNRIGHISKFCWYKDNGKARTEKSKNTRSFRFNPLRSPNFRRSNDGYWRESQDREYSSNSGYGNSKPQSLYFSESNQAPVYKPPHMRERELYSRGKDIPRQRDSSRYRGDSESSANVAFEDMRNSASSQCLRISDFSQCKVLSVTGSVQGNREIEVVVDTGSAHNILSSALAKNVRKITTGTNALRTADGHVIPVIGECDYFIRFENFEYEATFLVIDNSPVSAILGIPFLRSTEAIIDFSVNALRLRSRKHPLEITLNFNSNGSFFPLSKNNLSCVYLTGSVAEDQGRALETNGIALQHNTNFQPQQQNIVAAEITESDLPMDEAQFFNCVNKKNGCSQVPQALQINEKTAFVKNRIDRYESNFLAQRCPWLSFGKLIGTSYYNAQHNVWNSVRKKIY